MLWQRLDLCGVPRATLCEPMTRFGPHDPVPQPARRASIALGNFDGVHYGHQAVIAAARAAARVGAALGAAVFEPHPRRYFNPELPPFRLQSAAQRARTLTALGVDHVYEVRFDAALAAMSDEDFAREVLVNHVGAAHVCVGSDFRFGQGRMGDARSLAHWGERLGFGVTAIAPVMSGAARYSSSSIRAALATGEIARAHEALGRPWAIEGAVRRGFARGRDFGFPTANIALGDYVRPRLGVYAVRVVVDGVRRDGVASVGVNPTVGALPAPLLEAHIFDFDADLYDRIIEVEFVAFLRDETKFETVEALKAQMARDVIAAHEALAKA
jgi:riboflavin kinase / FMN adenylyltransferase